MFTRGINHAISFVRVPPPPPLLKIQEIKFLRLVYIERLLDLLHLRIVAGRSIPVRGDVVVPSQDDLDLRQPQQEVLEVGIESVDDVQCLLQEFALI